MSAPVTRDSWPPTKPQFVMLMDMVEHGGAMVAKHRELASRLARGEDVDDAFEEWDAIVVKMEGTLRELGR
jgi:hypothetical protein